MLCHVVMQEALNRQSRPTADELGLSMDPFTDSMSDLDTLDLRLEYVAAMMKGVRHNLPPFVIHFLSLSP